MNSIRKMKSGVFVFGAVGLLCSGFKLDAAPPN